MLDIRPDSKGNRFRLARIRQLGKLVEATLQQKDRCSILDVGGTYNFWHVWKDEIDWDRVSVTCANLNPAHLEEGKEETEIKMITANACDLKSVADNEYDIAFSNSVIEHVGPWRAMMAMAMAMAREVERVAPRYMIQTPNFWFPIEPHARTPLLHWMPEPMAYRLVMARKCGFWQKQDTVSGAVETVQSAKLIDYRQMQALFPSAEILREKFFGFTKALVAIKTN